MDTYQQNLMSNDLTKTKQRLFLQIEYVFWLLRKIGFLKWATGIIRKTGKT